MHKLVGATLLVCLAAPWQAYALERTHPLNIESSYVTAQYAQFSYKDGTLPGSYKPGGVVVKVGGSFSDYFAIEGRVASGFVTDSSTEVVGGSSTKIDAGIDYMYGLYAVGTLPILSRLDIYGVVGYTRTSATASFPDSYPREPDKKVEANDFSYGLGVGFKLYEETTVGLEYMSYMSKSGSKASALAIGLSQRF